MTAEDGRKRWSLTLAWKWKNEDVINTKICYE